MTRAGIGHDLHRLAEGRKLVIGGIEVPFHKGPVGHSDGDALAHAICDALLGAAGLGDIGTHFPDTAPRMFPKPAAEIHAAVNPFVAPDVAAILRERKWLRHEDEAAASWLAEAAALLGPRAENREALARLLALVFEYDAHIALASLECQEVLVREGAREVLRVLAT